MNIINRNDAIEIGENYYFTGIKCPNGHIAKRYTLNYLCVECKNENVRRYRERLRKKLRKGVKNGIKKNNSALDRAKKKATD